MVREREWANAWRRLPGRRQIRTGARGPGSSLRWYDIERGYVRERGGRPLSLAVGGNGRGWGQGGWLDESRVLTAGCNRHFRGKSRRCCLGCTGLVHLQARTATGLECRRRVRHPTVAAVSAGGGRGLVEKCGKRSFVVVGLDRRKTMAWTASSVVRTWWSSPEVPAVVGMEECVEGKGEE